MYRDEPNEPPNLVLCLVRRTKIVVPVLTLRLGRIGKVYRVKPKDTPNLALYLVRRTKIVVSVLTLKGDQEANMEEGCHHTHLERRLDFFLYY